MNREELEKIFKPVREYNMKFHDVKNKQIGVSIYPEKVGVNETKDYLKLASEYGVTKVFANLLRHVPDDKGKKVMSIYNDVGNYAKSLGMKVYYDVDRVFYKDWSLEPTETKFFLDLGAYGVRFDGGFNGVAESKVSQKMHIESNLSQGTYEVDETIRLGGKTSNMTVSHNFYPQEYTGLSIPTFIEWNTKAKERSLRTGAWLGLEASDRGYGPWDINDGLPTVEAHRHMKIEDQLMDLLSWGVVDDIMIGEQPPLERSEKIFQRIKGVMESYKKFFSLKEVVVEANIDKSISEIENKIVYDIVSMKNRLDSNTYFHRSSEGRVVYQSESIPPRNSGKILSSGDIVIMNEKMGKYKGELHILFKEVDDSERKVRNYVGSIKNKEQIFHLRLTDSYPKVTHIKR